MPPSLLLSVVIPLRHKHPRLDRCLRALRRGGFSDFEIIIATPAIEEMTTAQCQGIRLVEAPLGRGACLSVGMEQAKSEWILALHADTVLSDRWREVVETFIKRHPGRDAAGYFTFRQDSHSFKSRCIEWFVALRCALFALPYGDQGLLIRKVFYDRIGGYRSDFPIMEDVDIVRRIGRARLHRLDAVAVTSAERYERGYARRVFKNWRCLALYYFGIHPTDIAKLYERP